MIRRIGIAAVIALLTLTHVRTAAGDGGAYRIETFEQLEEFSQMVSEGDGAYAGEVFLMNDIRAVRPLTPIGDEQHMFCGLFDGQGHTISGLRIISAGDFAGLFGCVGKEGVIRNVTLENVLVSGERYTGAAAGYSAGLIEQCTVTGGRVIGRSQNQFSVATGGVVGLTDGRVRGCVNLGTRVYGGRYAGGIAGSVCAGSVDRCLGDGNVYSRFGGEALAGGIVGAVLSNGEIRECIGTAQVCAENASDAGGIAGSVFSGRLLKCIFIGELFSREPGAVAGYAAPRAQIMACRYDPSAAMGAGEGGQAGMEALGLCRPPFLRTEWFAPLGQSVKQ